MTRNSRALRSALTLTATLVATATAATTLVGSAGATPAGNVGHAPVDQLDRPIVFGHRGASGYRPEHTLASYNLAIDMGADFVEPDLVSTKDGVLVARHENEISGTTDVELHPEFANRKATKQIDGKPITGWFTEDFTLAELKTLRAEERIPADRPANTAYNGLYEVPTFEEVLDLVEARSAQTGRVIGVAPETKHPTYFDSIGLSLEEPLVAALKAHHLDGADAPAVIQSFEVSNLRDELNTMIDTPLVQLVDSLGGAPYDQVVAGTGVTNESLLSKHGLKGIRKYADWLSPYKLWVIGRNAGNTLGAPTGLVAQAHKNGLPVVIWTMRAENKNLPTECRIGTDPIAKGDLACEVDAYLDAGVDAFFTDQSDLGVALRDAWVAAQG